MTLLSRVLGLARDISFAVLVGAGANADSFFIAFKIPNFLRRLFAEGAFAQAFVPVLAEYREAGDAARARALVDRVAGALGGSLLVVTGVAIVAAPLLTLVFAPGFSGDAEKYRLTSELIRITFPYLFFISLTGLAGAVLNSYGRFAVPAFTPVLLNLCLIAGAVLGARYFAEPVYALAWGVFVAGLLQLAFQLPFLGRLQMLPRPRWDWGDSGVQRILALMGPALFGVSVSQINLLLDTVLASFLPTGSVSWLYFSDRLVELPLGVFGIAIATVILPSLARDKASDSVAAFSSKLDWGLRMVLLIGLPAALALMVLAEPVLTTLFQYRETLPRDIAMASYSLAAYAVGLVAFMLIKVLAPGYYARQDMKTPVRIGITAMVANMVMNLALVIPLHHFWQIGHVGLALATALAAWLNAGLLWRGLRRSAVYRPRAGWGRAMLRLSVAALAMTGVLLWLNPAMADWQAWNWWQRSLHLAGLCAAGAAVYAAVLLGLGLRLKDLRH
jgi:putative peptidoglycan lipid II flippase